MVAISVVYLGDLRCKALHKPSGSEIMTDAPVDNKGKGQNFSPTDLMATALASCIATVLGIYSKNLNWDLKGMRIEVQKEMSKTPPRRIGSLVTNIWLPLKYSDEAKAKIEEIAHSCPVHLSLHPDIHAPINLHWLE